jgi:hypothetical protein
MRFLATGAVSQAPPWAGPSGGGSDHDRAAVNDELRARDVRGLVAREEKCRVHDVPRGREPAEGEASCGIVSPSSADVDPTFTTAPPPAAIKCGIPYLQTQTIPLRLIANTRSQIPSSVSRTDTSRSRHRTPALCTGCGARRSARPRPRPRRAPGPRPPRRPRRRRAHRHGRPPPSLRAAQGRCRRPRPVRPRPRTPRRLPVPSRFPRR